MKKKVNLLMGMMNLNNKMKSKRKHIINKKNKKRTQSHREGKLSSCYYFSPWWAI
jgi:hypothetical protein